MFKKLELFNSTWCVRIFQQYVTTALSFSPLSHSLSHSLFLNQVLCSAVSDQTLLKTVTRIFSEAESARVTERPNGCEGHHHHHHHLLDHCSAAGPSPVVGNQLVACSHSKPAHGYVCVFFQILVCTMRSCSQFSTLATSTRLLLTTGGRCLGRQEKVTD